MKKTILESRFFASMCGSPYVRTVKDYEIDIECGDDRIYIYNSNEYKLKRGDVLVRKPGDLTDFSPVFLTVRKILRFYLYFCIFLFRYPHR